MISFPLLECWNDMTKMGTVVAEIDKNVCFAGFRPRVCGLVAVAEKRLKQKKLYEHLSAGQFSSFVPVLR
jgi:hypothetical protein